MSLLEGNPKAPRAWHGELPIVSRYTAGLAGERFFRALMDEGKLLASRCEACDITYLPARQFCERCMDELTEWTDAGLRGKVHTFTLLHLNLDGSEKEEPDLVAFIRFGDGGLVHRLGEVDPEEVEIGMAVEAVLKPKAKREGSILDIEYFKPAGD
ncbi:MAG: Zn-ribbon domain-containing OB-fold protein [Anaerolineales bacterium]|jgi:uncharacterized OB-fold protein